MRHDAGNQGQLEKSSRNRADFDDLAFLPARRVDAAPAKPDELDELIAFTSRLIPPLAAAAPAVRRVYARNPESIWAVHDRAGGISGAFAMLLVNDEGLRELLAGRFDTGNPPDRQLALPHERVAAIYFWAIATPGFAVDAFRVVSSWAQSVRFADADIYTRAATAAGLRMTLNLGFEPLPEIGLYRFRRHRNREEPANAA